MPEPAVDSREGARMSETKHDFDAQRREHSEPHELATPAPWVVLAVIAGVVAWAVSYIATSNITNEPPLGDMRTVSALAAPPAQAVDGGQIFAAQCAACHQATGLGIPGVFPPLAGSEWALGKDGLFAQILLHGITGAIEVKGATYNGAMPPFGDKLSDEEIAAVASYVRSAWGNGAGKIEAATVKTARSATHDRAEPWKGGDELAQFK